MVKDNSQSSSKIKFSTVDLMLIGMSIVWGINYSVVKIALEDLSPLSLNAIRFSVASLLLIVFLLIKERNLSIRREDISRLILLAIIGNTAYQLFFIYGISFTTAGNSAILYGTVPIFVGLLSSILGVEKITQRIWQSVIISFIGIILIIGGKGEALAITNQSWIGDLLILGATICWATYTVLSKPLLKRYTPTKLTTLTIAIGAIPLILISIPSLSVQRWDSVSTQGWLSIAYSSCLAIALGYVIWYTGVSHVGNARTSLYENLAVVTGVAVSWIFLSESMSLLQIIGAVLVFIGLYVARRTNHKNNNQ
jgi:drug/metabolite transporter (DMT)-like permease